MECNSISYSYSFVTRPFDFKEMCFREKGSKDFLMKPLYKNKFPDQYVRRLTQFKLNVPSSEIEYCKREIQYRAEVKFFLATDSVSVTDMTRRLSSFDKLSAFGNTTAVIENGTNSADHAIIKLEVKRVKASNL